METKFKPFCSQCGGPMSERRGGIGLDILFWDCETYKEPSWRNWRGHDSFIKESYFPLGPKFDPLTGEPLGKT